MAKKIENLFRKKEIQVVDSRPLDESFFNGYFSQSEGRGDKDTDIRLPPPPPSSRSKPTIIRASKSTENILGLDQPSNEKPAVETFGAFSTVQGSDPWGSMVNPSFRLESQKTKPAPSIPTSASSHQLRDKSNTQMFKKKLPPPRPTSRPGQGKLTKSVEDSSDSCHKSTNDLNLLSFDPLFNTSIAPSANRANPNSEELESIFSKRLSNSQSAFNFDSIGKSSYCQDLASIDWSAPAVPRISPRMHDKPRDISEPHAIALYDYNSDTEGDLSFKCGDIILLVKQVDQDWLMGHLQYSHIQGIFPASFVETKVPLKPIPSSPLAPSGQDIFSTSPKPMLPSKPAVLHAVNKTTAICPPRQHNLPTELIQPMKAETSSSSAQPDNNVELRGPTGRSGVSVKQRASMFESSGEHDTTNAPPKFIQTPPKKLTSAKLTAAVPPMPVPVPQPQPRKGRQSMIEREPTDSLEIAVALYDYRSNTPGDLSFNAGEKIIITAKIDSNWIKGKLFSSNQIEGLFPATFVKLEKSSETKCQPPPLPQREPDSKNDSDNQWFRAIYDFQAIEPGDLSLKVGDKVRLTGKISAEWLTGELIGGQKGQFPYNFVEPLSKSELSSFNNSRPQAEVLFDFPGDAEGDLSLQAGTVVYLLSQVNSDWFKGESSKTGETGIFPAAFVRMKIPLP